MLWKKSNSLSASAITSFILLTPIWRGLNVATALPNIRDITNLWLYYKTNASTMKRDDCVLWLEIT